MKSYLLILLFILLIGLFFRTFKIVELFAFAHDGDLYSWIVKDIVTNGHFRLVGQLTSADGIFIGPFFYYLLIPFFLLTNMDPLGVSMLGLLIGILTIVSYYFVISKLFNKTAGLVAAFLHASLYSTVDFDRWIVPTLPVKLWAVWYLYTLLIIARGNFSVLPILGILIGLIWHIHIALVPTMLAVPVAILISKKKPKIEQILQFIFALAITSLPLILFELRHNFSQTASLIQNFTTSHGGQVGIPKLMQVLEMISKNTTSLFFAPNSINPDFRLPFLFILFSAVFLLIKKKLLKSGEAVSFFSWFIGIILFYTFSSTLISEYYFANLEIIFITIVSLLFVLFIKSSKLGFYLTFSLFGLILIQNSLFLKNSEPNQTGYMYRKAVAEYILKDSKERGFPCVGINYITSPGENVGFRYFFYLNNLHTVKPSNDIPVYNIVLPFYYSEEVEKRFGAIGIINPTSTPKKEVIEKTCQGPNTNLTDTVFGYVE